VLKKRFPRIPGPLVVVTLVTAAAFLGGLGDRGVALLGEVPSGLPAPALPAVGLAELQALLVPALMIALLSFMEGISVAKAIASRTHERIDASQELLASGASNVAAGVFQAFPVAGGFSRTAVNHQAGARTPVASLITAATVALAALALTPLFTFLPRAVLAAIVVVAVAGLVDLAGAKHAWRTDRWDFATLATTFAATLLLGVELGIGIGIGASLLLLVARSARPHITELGLVAETGHYRNVDRYDEDRPARPADPRRRGPAVRHRASGPPSVEQLCAARDDRLEVVVLDFSAVSDVDGDGAHVLDDLARTLAVRAVDLHLATVRGPVRDALARMDRWEALYEGSLVHEDVAAALRAIGLDELASDRITLPAR
jgi:sulfate permease, SulP family